MSYKDLQDEWVKNTGLKIGDTVRCILTLSGEGENNCGWNADWNVAMAAGDAGKVLDIREHGILMAHPHGITRQSYDGKSFWYPFYVLVKEEE